MARAVYRKDQQCPRCGSNWLPKYTISGEADLPLRSMTILSIPTSRRGWTGGGYVPEGSNWRPSRGAQTVINSPPRNGLVSRGSVLFSAPYASGYPEDPDAATVELHESLWSACAWA